jgi:chromosome segregation ATPase
MKTEISEFQGKFDELQKLLQMEKFKTDKLSQDLLEKIKKESELQKQIIELQRTIQNEKLKFDKLTLDLAESQKALKDVSLKDKSNEDLQKKIADLQKQISDLQKLNSENEKNSQIKVIN